jgi:hypothetical protein
MAKMALGPLGCGTRDMWTGLGGRGSSLIRRSQDFMERYSGRGISVQGMEVIPSRRNLAVGYSG